MNNLRAIFLLLGIIMVGLNVVLFIAEVPSPGIVLVSPIALIGASIYYTLAERRKPSKKEVQQREERLQQIRTTWRAITVLPDECEIKSSKWIQEVGQGGGELSLAGVLVATQVIPIFEAAKADGRSPGTEVVSQSVLVVQKDINGQQTTFISHFIPKDPTTLLFLLHEYKGFNIYVNPEDPSQFLFDAFLD